MGLLESGGAKAAPQLEAGAPPTASSLSAEDLKELEDLDLSDLGVDLGNDDKDKGKKEKDAEE